MIKMRKLLSESDESEYKKYLEIYKEELVRLKKATEMIEKTINNPDFKILSIGSGFDGIISKMRNASSSLETSLDRIPQWIRIEKNKLNKE